MRNVQTNEVITISIREGRNFELPAQILHWINWKENDSIFISEIVITFNDKNSNDN